MNDFEHKTRLICECITLPHYNPVLQDFSERQGDLSIDLSNCRVIEQVRASDNILKSHIKDIKSSDSDFEVLMQIMLLNPNEISTRRVIHCFEDFKDMYEVQTEIMDSFTKQIYTVTPMTQKITHISWPESRVGQVVLTAVTSCHSTEWIKQKAYE